MATEGAIEPRPELPRELYLGEEDEPEDIPLPPEAMLGFDPVETIPEYRRSDVIVGEGEEDYLEPIEVGGERIVVEREKIKRPVEPIEVVSTDELEAFGVKPTDIAPDVVVPRIALEPVAPTSGEGRLSPMEPFLEWDHNTNKGRYVDADGSTIMTFDIASGDTTGTRHGQKFFSPVGEFRIDKKYENMYFQYPELAPVPGFTIDAPGVLHADQGPQREGIQRKPRTHKAAGHGTFKGPASSLSTNEGRVSHGCVRHVNDTMRKLYDIVSVGTLVKSLPYNDPVTGKEMDTEVRRLGKPEFVRRTIEVKAG